MLDIFLFVGKKLVDVAVSLNVDLVDKSVERFFNLLFQFRYVLVKMIQHQDAKVSHGGFEFLDVLYEEQCLDQASIEVVFKVSLGKIDGLLDWPFKS